MTTDFCIFLIMSTTIFYFSMYLRASTSLPFTFDKYFPLRLLASSKVRSHSIRMNLSPPSIAFASATQVFWDGREIGTTVVRRKTLNPVWVVEANKGTAGYKRSSNGTSNIKQHKTAASVAEEDQPYFWLESVSSVNPRLRVELYDWDAVGSHDFLGGVELSLEEIVDLQRITLGKAKMSGGKTDQQVLRGLKLWRLCLETAINNYVFSVPLTKCSKRLLRRMVVKIYSSNLILDGLAVTVGGTL